MPDKKKKKPTPKPQPKAQAKSAPKKAPVPSAKNPGRYGNADDFKKPGASEGEQMMNVAMFLSSGSAMGEIARKVVGKLGQMGAKDEAAAVLKAIHKAVGSKAPTKMSRVDDWNTLAPGHPVMQAMEKALKGASDRMGSMAQPSFHPLQRLPFQVQDEILDHAGAIGGNARLNAIGTPAAAAAAQQFLQQQAPKKNSNQ